MPAPAVTAAAAARESASLPAVAPLRTDAERARDLSRAHLFGPAVRIRTPRDGAVVRENRIYVGVEGEPGRPVALLEGGRELDAGVIRPDGLFDFIGVPLHAGPNHLRVVMRNSWNQERWDSIAVHLSGAPARIALVDTPPALYVDSRAQSTVVAQVLDEWGVAIRGGTLVTAEATGATVTGTDVDRGSAGVQLRTREDGLIAVPLVAGHIVGPGRLDLRAGKATLAVALRVLPAVRPLIATGAARIAVGEGPGSYGAVTVRGALGAETAVSVSYDSRDHVREQFGRGSDPLDESLYPTTGDASTRRSLSGASQHLSARLEHGFDWIAVGDVRTEGFASGGNQLTSYDRSLNGATARVGTGPIVWNAFASSTRQTLQQLQLRGDGSSGPYRLGERVRPGTERLAIEVRARSNAARLVSRRELARYNDYRVEYETGEVELQFPIPSTDPSGNPVFLVGTVELEDGGERHLVGGLRMEVDAARLLAPRHADSLGVALFGIRDGAAFASAGGTGSELFGGDVRYRRGGLTVGGELFQATTGDSAAVASRASAVWEGWSERLRFDGEWTRVGTGFQSAANPRLRAGLDEIRLGTQLRLAPGSAVQLTHARERFEQLGIERRNTLATLAYPLFGRAATVQGGVTSDRETPSGRSTDLLNGRATLAISKGADAWVETSHAVASDSGALARPDQLGAGLSVKLFDGIRLEGSHRFVTGTDSSIAVTGIRLQADGVLAGRVWGGVDRSSIESLASHSAVLGWDQKLAIGGGWSVRSLFERRVGLDRMPLLDPARAMPFPQLETDQWSAGARLDWQPRETGRRFSAHGEVFDGHARDGFRIEIAGDAQVGRDAAILTLHDWSQDHRVAGYGARLFGRRDRSLLGFALRPAATDAWNALGKVEWRRTVQPAPVLGSAGAVADDARMIASADVIYTPSAAVEAAFRYAIRSTRSAGSAFDTGAMRGTANYFGSRVEHELHDRLRGRLDGRALVESTTGRASWSIAPSLLFRISEQLDVEGGYRLGDLRDEDFDGGSGSGYFAALGLRLTEGELHTVADFWRARLGQER